MKQKGKAMMQRKSRLTYTTASAEDEVLVLAASFLMLIPVISGLSSRDSNFIQIARAVGVFIASISAPAWVFILFGLASFLVANHQPSIPPLIDEGEGSNIWSIYGVASFILAAIILAARFQ